jgi:hypothetical protein
VDRGVLTCCRALQAAAVRGGVTCAHVFVHVYRRAKATASTVAGRAWHSCSTSVVLVTHLCSAEVHLGWLSCQHQMSGWAGAMLVMACALLHRIHELAGLRAYCAAHSCTCIAWLRPQPAQWLGVLGIRAALVWCQVTHSCSAVHLGWMSCQHQLSGWAGAVWVMALVHCYTLFVSWLRIGADCAAHSCMCFAGLRPQSAQWLGVLGIRAALVWC